MAVLPAENPYVVGMYISDPEKFFGRDDILNTLASRIQAASQAVAIRLSGQRRIGKTSIVRVFQRSHRHIALPVFISMQITTQTIEILLDRFKNYILDELLYDQGAAELPAALAAFRARDQLSRYEFHHSFIPAVIKVLGDRPLVLIFDEFENLANDYLDSVRQALLPLLVDLLDLRIGMIFVIGDPKADISPDFAWLFRQASNIHTSFFTLEQTEQVLRRTAGDTLNFQPDGIARLFALTSGHPMYVSAFGSLLWDHYHHTGTPLKAMQVDAVLSQVMQEVEMAFVYLLRHTITVLERQMLHEIMKRQPRYPDRKVPVSALAQDFGGFELRPETAWQIVQMLVRREIIGFELAPDDTERVYFLIEPMRRWVEHQGQPPTPEELEAELLILQPDVKRAADDITIFISYSRTDWDEFVTGLVDRLDHAGYNVWVDQHLMKGGEDWMDALGKALDQCSLLILVASPDAIASRYVKMEYRYFFHADKPIIPLMLKPVKLPPELHLYQYIDFSMGSLDSHFEQLFQALKAVT
ncbi:MAG: TIR domain-containing protein [Anaerolineae bacterium]|nr:TIR domain-containing protein [Anaerolineae bacterium]